MRNFELGRQFAGIFIATNSFSHLYSRDDIEACLAAVRRHLRITVSKAVRYDSATQTSH
jgi:hypothetical protein